MNKASANLSLSERKLHLTEDLRRKLQGLVSTTDILLLSELMSQETSEWVQNMNSNQIEIQPQVNTILIQEIAISKHQANLLSSERILLLTEDQKRILQVQVLMMAISLPSVRMSQETSEWARNTNSNPTEIQLQANIISIQETATSRHQASLSS